MAKTKQEIIGGSPAFLEVLEQTSQLAGLNRSVLIIGERGTGKELIAERLHYLSPRWAQAFVRLDCASLAPGLLESELFGHEVGAFTGAQRKRRGRFELANNGTLFLDELANAPMTVQEKLLRVIEYGTFERVGGNQMVQVDVRLIAATNQDLPALAESGEFRADLLDRLAFDVITLPPLRKRKADILVLAEHFAVRMSSELKRDFFPGFTRACEDQLLAYHWPGNVRELKNVVERAVYRMTAPDKEIREVIFDPFDSPWRPANSQTTPGDKPPAIELPVKLREHISALEIEYLNAALKQSRYQQSEAARLLGLTYHQLRGMLKKYDLQPKDQT